ncbi:tRNA (adenosine(37)-N6)-threonylcarbamoyltransferase complex ATPase subunit type 1 TsaE [Aureimonas sp. AU12]|uniref:tRNA (adenosine(37)-N6)-threonylcarbamoyltransferase complex ATPase subunit type 1 TsaE n=1 Tax=Aureimonas sp. AU12 TaxID=1638161 RepID=UPI0007819CB2|nr:tRNA (adenosine(37)-N6)-threonylcarbamoyltransferase complex ATPase subunit type 1 TsaE [Aureimonas sp. AU12]
MSVPPSAADLDTGERIFAVDLPDDAATGRLAADLALVLGLGDVVALSGELGAGKTTFARAFLRALAGDPALDVPSPTYTLVQIYETRPKTTHFDLYRIGDEAELFELGFDEAAETGIVLCEWPERAAHALDLANIHLTLRDGAGGGRVAEIRCAAEAARRVGRTLQIRRFLTDAGHPLAARAPFPGDASARRYESVRTPGGHTLVLMDAPRLPPGKPVKDGLPYTRIAHIAEDVRPFVAIAATLDARGLTVPAIHSSDLDAGLVVMSDLGSEGVLDAQGRPMPERYEAAARALAALHVEPFDPRIEAGAGLVHVVPSFDHGAMAIEVGLFLQWYWPHRHHRPADTAEEDAFAGVWRDLFQDLDLAERNLLLRDVHSPNLLWQPGESGARRIGFLDFQDAMIGPTAYDLASLAQDARVDVPAELEARLVAAYISARRAQDPAFDAFAFERAYAIMAAQRATKILGIFVRLMARDGKPQYLRHIPRIKTYLNRTLDHPALEALAALYRDWDILADDPEPPRP